MHKEEGFFMSNILFPAGLSINFSDLNIEMVQYYSKKWDLVHTQMSKGVFKAKMTVAHTPRIQLATNAYTTGLMTKGDFPKGTIVLNCHMDNNTPYTFQNTPILPNEIIVMTKGDEIDRISSGPFTTHNITIDEQLFYEAFYTFFGETPYYSLKLKRFYIKEDMISVFHQTINNWISYLTDTLPKLDIKPIYNKIEYEILSQLFTCLAFPSSKKDKKKFPIETVRDFLHKNMHQDIDITLITQEFNISESQLHNLFKSNYGISPKKYLQILRLNAARKALQIADPRQDTVSDIALKFNFLTMSYFSKEYKEMFGQTPSQTLKK